MKRYNFYDTDIFGNEDYDIAGKDYVNLLNFCFKNAKIFSLKYSSVHLTIYESLKAYEIGSCVEVIKNEKVVYYKTCEQTFNILSKHVNSIFCWMFDQNENPEDLMFFREDGSILFSSCIHNGMLSLWIKNENESSILTGNLWIPSEEDVRNSIYKKTTYFNFLPINIDYTNETEWLIDKAKDAIFNECVTAKANKYMIVDTLITRNSLTVKFQCKDSNENFMMITVEIANGNCELTYECV